MRKPLLVLSFFLLLLTAAAQHRVTITVTHFPDYHQEQDPVYIAGPFNNWNPGAEKWKLKELNGRRGITIELPSGMTEYKFTRGSWNKAEAGAEGSATQNRRFMVDRDTAIEEEIRHWSDHFPPPASLRSTAGRNVRVLDTAFFMPQLNRHRRIWICLPESYDRSRDRYPVLYMHDAQNLFDDAMSFSGEWGVDEAMDSLGPLFGECIIVGIDNGGEKRLNEYSPYDMERFGRGEGRQYVDFLVKTLRPYIDRNFRTRRDGRHNYLAGSSMGGLISLYALLRYPKKFGGAGVFSPAFWIAPGIRAEIASRARRVRGRIYFFAGQQEHEGMIPEMLSVFELMNQHSHAELTTVVRAEGRHSEITWREEFPLFYQWLMR